MIEKLRPMFSHIATRLPGPTNRLYQLRSELERQGRSIIDLVSGNVNQQGILFPQEAFEDILLRSARASRVYHPDSFGQKPARQAIADYYGSHGDPIDPNCIVLTPGTSIAYWYSFKLLANEGDEILCPRPSYPLFDYIAALSGVKLISYELVENRSWAIDLDRLDASISTKTRALILISPHNPTGHVSPPEEIRALAEIARRHQMAIIVDEVFSEFLIASRRFPRATNVEAPLVITLNGFSKMFALPGFKLGWMAVSGRRDRVKEALQALEMISDTFLPVSELAQAAVPDIFSSGQDFLNSYVREIQKRWTIANLQLANCPCFTFSPPDGGFYVILKLGKLDEETAAEMLMSKASLLVHPGHFYDMDPHHLILSFVQEPSVTQPSLSLLNTTLTEGQ